MTNKKISQFDYGEVKLLNSRLKTHFTKGLNYYMNISVDDMLFELRKKCNIENAKGSKSLHYPKGSWFHLGGNVLGQWLQAYARFYKVTGSEEVLKKANELVDGFYEIAKHSKVFFDGLFMYFFEKYLRGFTENYLYCGNEKAYILAKDFVSAALDSKEYQYPKLILGNNGPNNEIEWYTLSESILFFYGVAKDKKEDKEFLDRCLNLANRFKYTEFWDIAYNHEDILDYSPLEGQNTEFFHSYSHLNSYNSAMKFYELTGNKYYLDATMNFYDYVRECQELITGGYGAHKEWFLSRAGIITAVKRYHDSFETQCDSYAVYRLSNSLMSYTGDAKYGNWEEKLFYNATLSTINMSKIGRIMYYSDYNTKGAKKVLIEPTWTCCTGTRPLLLSELTRTIYFKDDNSLYVNLYTPSCISYNGLKLEALDDASDTSELRFKVSSNKNKLNILFRRPEWAKEVKLYINDIETEVIEDNSWISSRKTIKRGDIIMLILKKELESSSIIQGKLGIFGLKYGPVVLTLKKEEGVNPNIIDFNQDINKQVALEDGSFKILNTSSKLVPFMDLSKDEEYYLYFEWEK